MINVHYLELFYYLARHGGVSEATKRMPYGIRPCTLSRQIIQLEEQVGACLCQRRPFRLTPAGERLFHFIRPFFEDMSGMIDELRRGTSDFVRLAAAPIVLRDYLPPLLRALQEPYPQLRFTLKEGLQWQIREWFEARLLDLAITMLEGSPPTDCLWEVLLSLPMVLLVNTKSPIRSAEEIIGHKRIAHTLIGPKRDDAISRCFKQGLLARSLEWDIGIEMNSIELVESYVLHGFGVGVSVTVPGRPTERGLRALPLQGFPPLQVGMIWKRNPSPLLLELMTHLRQQATKMAGQTTA
jgi:DNA-binding transcriptional LysR family regulator